MRTWLGVVLLGACSGPQPTPVDLARELPPAWLEDGVQSQHGSVPLIVEPELRDGVTALAECAANVSVCLERTDGNFERCVRKAPSCATAEPWNEAPCCPPACKDQFAERVNAGSTGFDAYVQVFVRDGSCVPTLTPLREQG